MNSYIRDCLTPIWFINIRINSCYLGTLLYSLSTNRTHKPSIRFYFYFHERILRSRFLLDRPLNRFTSGEVRELIWCVQRHGVRCEFGFFLGSPENGLFWSKERKTGLMSKLLVFTIGLAMGECTPIIVMKVDSPIALSSECRLCGWFCRMRTSCG